ncbi:MAG TPA: FtsX-like permease family protein [Streptosporangiaceae bacterium]
MGASWLVLGAVLLNTAVAAALAAALASFAGQALTQAAVRQIETAAQTSIAVNGAVTLGQARSDTAAIRSSLRTAFGTVPVTLQRSLWSDSLGLRSDQAPKTGQQIALTQAAAPDRIRQMTTLISGTWPSDPAPADPAPAGTARASSAKASSARASTARASAAQAPLQAALPATAAALLHLRVGSLLELRDRNTGAPVQIRLTGIYRPRNAAASYWRLNLIGPSGASAQGGFTTYGPLVVPPQAFTSQQLTTGGASWVAVPDVTKISGGFTALAGRIKAMATDLTQSGRFGGLQVTTGLPGLLSGVGANVIVARSLLVIGGLLLLVLVAGALTLASRVLATRRESESALLSARGGSRGQLVALNAAESLLLAAVAVVAGALLGGRLAALLASTGPLRADGLSIAPDTPAAWWAAAATALVCVAITLGPALRPLTPEAARVRRGRPAVVAALARAGGDSALVVLAVLTGWQLRHFSLAGQTPYGNSVLASAGGLGVDPVLAVAPALAVAAGTVVLLRLLPPLAKAGDRMAGSGRRLFGTLAVWEISRNPVRKTSVALLVVLGVATGTLALAQHESWQRSANDQAAFTAGADVRVSLPAPLPLARVGTVAHARGVTSAEPVTTVPLPATGSSLIALDARRAAATVLLRPDLSKLPPATLWRLLRPASSASPASPAAPAGIALPGRPARLEISASLGPARARIAPTMVSLSVQDGSGAVYQIPAGPLPADGRGHDLVATLAPSRQALYPLRLLAISVGYQLPAVNPKVNAAFTVTSATASDSSTGAFAAPFTTGAALQAWTPTLSAAPPTDLLQPAKPLTPGQLPAARSWASARAGAQRLTFRSGYGELTPASASAPEPVQATLLLTAGNAAIPVIPAIATQSYLHASQISVGGVVQIPVDGVTIPIRIAASVAGFPTVGTGGALIVDQATVQDILAAQAAPPLAVPQWWLATSSPGVPPGLPGGATVADRAKIATALLADPLSVVPQQALLALAFAAALLAAAGFAVSVIADAAASSGRAALLAALGMSPAQQARLNCVRELMLSVPAAAVGLLLGGLVARLLIPAVTLTTSATRPFPPVIVEFDWARAVVIAVVVAAIPALVAVASAARRPDPAARLRAVEEA